MVGTRWRGEMLRRLTTMYYGDKLTLEECGAKFGCTRERIRQVLNERAHGPRTVAQAIVARHEKYPPRMKRCARRECGSLFFRKSQTVTDGMTYCSVSCAQLGMSDVAPRLEKAVALLQREYTFTEAGRRTGLVALGLSLLRRGVDPRAVASEYVRVPCARCGVPRSARVTRSVGKGLCQKCLVEMQE
ncbi:MAG: hypothetical protein A2W26_03195 [Acidobacteria bacterium RBG_16_64_8]|nr:MAG: hypothetical protein A2W26_03195 [Acidobacteria bacterium RBG_16_64_8]